MSKENKNTANEKAVKGNGFERTLFGKKFELFNKEGVGSVRTLLKSDGTIWFVGADVCKCLGIKLAPRAYDRLRDYERMTIHNMNSHSGQRGGAQSLVVISESGLYRLAMTSRLEGAIQFQDWIAQEVLPSIRKTGGYIFGQEDLDAEKQKELARQVTKLAMDNNDLNEYADLWEGMYDFLMADFQKVVQENHVLREKQRRGAIGETKKATVAEAEPEVVFTDASGIVYSSRAEAIEANRALND